VQSISDDKLFLVQSMCDQLDNKSRQLDYDYKAIAEGEKSIISPVKQPEIVKPVAVVSNGSSSRVEVPPIRAAAQEANSRRPKIELPPPPETVTAKQIVQEVVAKPVAAPVASISNGNANTKSPAKATKPLKRSTSKTHKEPKKSRREANSSPTALYEENPADPDEPTYCSCNQISFGEMIGCDNNSCPIEWFHFKCVQLVTKPKGKWFCPQCRGDRPNVPRK